MKVYWDKWDKVNNLSGETEVISFVEIEKLIQQLDQSIHTQVILNSKENYLLIGGGNGQYIVSFVVGNDEDFYTLINKDKRDIDEEITVVTGGQAGSFPEKIVVNYTAVIEASHYYFEHLDKSPNLQWINE
jgi:hypothetical protein